MVAFYKSGYRPTLPSKPRFVGYQKVFEVGLKSWGKGPAQPPTVPAYVPLPNWAPPQPPKYDSSAIYAPSRTGRNNLPLAVH